MTESMTHKILVVENSEDLRLRIKKILVLENFEVHCVSSANDAFTCLDESGGKPFSIIISGYQMPKMKGDMILKEAKEHSPETRRMLLAHASDLDTIINAINIAEIHSCLSMPFNDRELVLQVHERCKEFEFIEKKRLLKIVTGTQNKQMYKIAVNFKNKEKIFINQIEEKKKKINALKSKICAGSDQITYETPENIEKFIYQKGIPPSTENFVKEFILLKDKTKNTLTGLMSNISDTSMEPSDIDYKTIARRPDPEPDSDPGLKKHPSESAELIDMIIKLVLRYDKKARAIPGVVDEDDFSQQDQDNTSPHDYLELIIPEDRLTGLIKIKKNLPDTITLDILEEYLKENQIQFGLKDDKLMGIWLKNAKIEDEPFVIAQGILPEFGENAEIQYYFKTDFKKAGKILADGSIDFRDRGDIPFVTKDTLLAEKTMAVKGKSGVDIFGEEIPVSEPEDFFLGSGAGTRFSENKLKVFADSDGMPHIDAMGNVAVLSELTIPDDVDYKTGNLDFNGNIVVKGVVKAGFSIKCSNLTIKEIEGAEIDLSGDLNVAVGIIDSNLVKVQGNVQAKYVNNSKIKAFGDIIIQKEIIDSRISISGACINETGHIISSYISARKGIIAGSIGTEVSLPSTIKVGLNEHIEFFINKADEKLNKNIEAIKTAKREIDEFEAENNDLNIKISEFAFIQDRSGIELRDIEKKLNALKASEDTEELKKISAIVSDLRRKIQYAGKKLNNAFIRQKTIIKNIKQKKISIRECETDNKKLIRHKKKLTIFSKEHKPIAEVKVKKKIIAGTIIIGPKSSIRIHEPRTRCRIMEVEMKEDEKEVGSYYKMDISDLS